MKTQWGTPATSRTAEPAVPAAADAAGSRSLTRYRESTGVAAARGRGAVLVVDVDPSHRELVADILGEAGYRCDLVPSGEAALEVLKSHNYDLVITELILDGVGGMEILHQAKESNPLIVVILLTGYGSIENAVQAVKQGAANVLTKPVHPDQLRSRVKEALEEAHRLRLDQRERPRALAPRFSFEGIIGTSEKMRRVIDLCARIAETDAAVLITGESGTGKELVAKAIHHNSKRKNKHFLPINCAALSPNVIESELFGHEKGAFTGANFQRIGRFEHANHGTIFLDEVGDIPPETQVKLLRVLDEFVISRVGSNEHIRVDVRVISATHRNLDELVKEGKFRDDLYYRLKVVTIHLPPLRERSQDIPALAEYFIRHYSTVYEKNFTEIDRDAMAALVAHPWKGNVRELKHIIENLVVTAPGPVISLADIPESIQQSRQAALDSGAAIAGLVGLPIKDVERELIKNTLARVQGNRQEAARLLGIGERTLYRKLKRYSLS